MEDENTLACETPNFDGSQPGLSDVRLIASGHDITITQAQFSYFLNTKADKTVAFGPGVFPENNISKESLFYIQTKNKLGDNRESGGDQFLVDIWKYSEETTDEENKKEEEQIVVPYVINDEGNGRYKIQYTYDGEPIDFNITIKLKNEFDQYELIKGGIMKVSWRSNAMNDNSFKSK